MRIVIIATLSAAIILLSASCTVVTPDKILCTGP